MDAQNLALPDSEGATLQKIQKQICMRIVEIQSPEHTSVFLFGGYIQISMLRNHAISVFATGMFRRTANDMPEKTI